MQKLISLSKLIMILSIITFTFNASADGDEEGIFKRWFESKNNGVSPVKFEQYNELCDSCHQNAQHGDYNKDNFIIPFQSQKYSLRDEFKM